MESDEEGTKDSAGMEQGETDTGTTSLDRPRLELECPDAPAGGSQQHACYEVVPDGAGVGRRILRERQTAQGVYIHQGMSVCAGGPYVIAYKFAR